MRPGDKVILKTNAPLKIWGIHRERLLGNIYTIRLIKSLTSGIEAYTFEAYMFEELRGYVFPADEFIPYKGLTVLIDRRRKRT
jgi:hypothetical protein